MNWPTAEYRSTFGAEHPFALIAATNLASDMVAAGYLREARELGEQILEISGRTRGESHPDTLAIAANLSLDRQACGDITACGRAARRHDAPLPADAFLDTRSRGWRATVAASMWISSLTECRLGDPKLLDPGCCLSA